MPSEKAKPSAARHAATRDWGAYYDAVEGKGPRETLIEALDLFEGAPESPRLAIDLGCGDGRDTVELLRRGWRVHAIDAEQEAFTRLFARADLCGRDRLTIVVAPFHLVELPHAALVNASFALPFCPPEYFDALWAKILRAIEPGGRFAGQLFGDRDTWASLPDRTHQSRDQVERLLAPFVIEGFREEERDGEDATGYAKHWHIYHIVARKAAPGNPNEGGAT